MSATSARMSKEKCQLLSIDEHEADEGESHETAEYGSSANEDFLTSSFLKCFRSFGHRYGDDPVADQECLFPVDDRFPLLWSFEHEPQPEPHCGGEQCQRDKAEHDPHVLFVSQIRHVGHDFDDMSPATDVLCDYEPRTESYFVGSPLPNLFASAAE